MCNLLIFFVFLTKLGDNEISPKISGVELIKVYPVPYIANKFLNNHSGMNCTREIGIKADNIDWPKTVGINMIT